LKFIKNLFLENKAGKFHQDAPLIIFESDDWGCIRMPSKFVKEKIANIAPAGLNDPYLQYDSLETNEDLEALFNLLSDYKDINGKMPVVTANYIMQNPDFFKIKESNFQVFYAIDFRKSYLLNKNSDKSFLLQTKAYEEGIFYPQFHGREHIHIKRWMQALKNGDTLTQLAFEHELISLRSDKNPPCISFYMDAFHPHDESDLNQINNYIIEGLEKFRDTWGYKAKSVIAPCYFWHNQSERIFAENGINVIQGLRVQKESRLNGNPYKFKKVLHRQGSVNQHGQKYFYRNAFFEPSLDTSVDWVNQCLGQLKQSIKKFGYVIVSVHRLNFMGAIEPANRSRNLKMFGILLKQLHEHYPGLQYGTSLDLIATP
jgi:hypothetical protein